MVASHSRTKWRWVLCALCFVLGVTDAAAARKKHAVPESLTHIVELFLGEIKTPTNDVRPRPTPAKGDRGDSNLVSTSSSDTASPTSLITPLPTQDVSGTLTFETQTTGTLDLPSIATGTASLTEAASREGLSAAAIAGIVIGAVVGVLLLFAGGWFLGRRQKKGGDKDRESRSDDGESKDGNESGSDSGRWSFKEQLDVKGLVKIFTEMDGAMIHEADEAPPIVREIDSKHLQELDEGSQQRRSRESAIWTQQGRRYELGGNYPTDEEKRRTASFDTLDSGSESPQTPSLGASPVSDTSHDSVV